MNGDNDGVLTKHERMVLIYGTAVHDPAPVSKDRIASVFEQIERMVIDGSIARCVLNGLMVVTGMDDKGEAVFRCTTAEEQERILGVARDA